MLVPVTIPSQNTRWLRVVVDDRIAIKVPSDFDHADLP
jgi:hypothetical protein